MDKLNITVNKSENRTITWCTHQVFLKNSYNVMNAKINNI